jgi:hypothetical protein
MRARGGGEQTSSRFVTQQPGRLFPGSGDKHRRIELTAADHLDWKRARDEMTVIVRLRLSAVAKAIARVINSAQRRQCK